MNVGGINQSFCKTLCVVIMLGSSAGSMNLSAQENAIFSGAGIRGLGVPSQQVTDEAEKKAWPGFFGQNRMGDTIDRKPLKMPKLGLFKNSAPKFNLDLTNNARPRMFEGLPRLLPERDPNRPNVFQDFNSKTKAMFSRSSDGLSGWANRTNENARSRSFDAWDSISRGFKNPLGLGTGNAPPPTQPPLRSAHRFEEKPSVKF